MSLEAQISLTVSAQKNGAQINRSYVGALDMTGNLMDQKVQQISSGTWTSMFCSFADPQLISLTNLDPTETVLVAKDGTGTDVIAKVLPGCTMVWSPPGSQVYYLSATPATPNYVLVETVQIEA